MSTALFERLQSQSAQPEAGQPCQFLGEHDNEHILPCVECRVPTCENHARGVGNLRRCPRCTLARIRRNFKLGNITPEDMAYWRSTLQRELPEYQETLTMRYMPFTEQHPQFVRRLPVEPGQPLRPEQMSAETRAAYEHVERALSEGRLTQEEAARLAREESK